jgi:aspartate-semialdehyde dehydrogenase
MTTKVAILGACGVIGQRYVQMLNNHPKFEVAALVDVYPGKKYSEVTDWGHGGGFDIDIPEYVRDMKMVSIDDVGSDVSLAFSGLPPKVAGEMEEKLAKKGVVVVTKAGDYRMEADVPLIIPEVNPQHLSLIKEQRKNHGWKGAIVTAPNCSTSTFVVPLKPVYDMVGVKKLTIVTMQAFSGAGYPGVPSLDITDNVIPYIGGEEEKLDIESKKILGDGKKPAEYKINVYCNRVPALDGHLESVFLETKKKITVDEMKQAMRDFPGTGLYTGPEKPVIVREEKNRPQTRIDRYAGKGPSPYTAGMSVTCGRFRDLGDNEMSFVCLAHNTIRGGAGEAILIGELLEKKGYL